VIRPHEVQRMSAGRGVSHSEFNASQEELVHFLQIWILPRRGDLAPSYEQRLFPLEEKRNRLRLLASEDGRDGAVTIHQDAELYGTVLDAGAQVRHALKPGRYGWVQVARGDVLVNGEMLHAGDGAALSDETAIELVAPSPAEVLVFDLG
jgi:redox-sensitive bicupin YhaK (pirin superfamily)